MSEHWLDRLSVQLTRRQAMKAGLAGAILGGAPLARPAASAATTGSASLPCFKGCIWTGNKRFQSTMTACTAGFFSGTLGYFANPVYGFFGTAAAMACKDRAVLAQKASTYDCVQTDDCGGFNPKARGGPCDDCHQNCCPCGASDNGYICCVFDCHDPTNNCCPGGAGE